MGYDFHRQKPIDKFIVDFFCVELMLAIEIDGYSHQSVETYEKDIQKEKRLNEFGVSVLRFQDQEIYYDIENFLRSIEIFIDKFKKQTPNRASQPLSRGE